MTLAHRIFSMNTKAFLLITGIGAILSCSPICACSEPVYTLKTIQAGNRTGYDIIRLYNRKTHRTIWTRKLKYVYSRHVAWSKDKRAVALELSRDKILIWRSGYRTRFLPAPRADYIMWLLWSPDKQRLLVGSGNSGMNMTPTSRLFCLNIQKRRVYSSDKIVGSAVWASSRKVRYTVLSYNERTAQYTPQKSRIWRVP